MQDKDDVNFFSGKKVGQDSIDDSKSTVSNTNKSNNWSIFSESKNMSFLNQELLFFIDNLHQKATENGLAEDALITKRSKKDVQIYNMLKGQSSSYSRPQSAFTTEGMNKTGQSNMNKKQDILRDYSDIDY